MNLPDSVIAYADRWNALVSGSTSAVNGTPSPIAMMSAISACHARLDSSAGRGGSPSAKPASAARSSGGVAPDDVAEPEAEAGEVADVISCLRAAALQGKHALRTLLDEKHDQHEYGNLREHGAPERLDRLADEAEPKAADHRPGQLPDAAQHHGHERIDDVALPEIRADIADLRQRTAAE